MVDELLAFYNDGENLNRSGNQDESIKVTRDNIKAIIMDIMFGGTETVAGVIEWAMAELLHSPEDLHRIQQELTDVVGLNCQLEESDFEKLTYLKCALKETLRLHPPVPLIFHENASTAKVSGYHVPAKSRIMINLWAIGHDKSSWIEPNTFKPSRFLEEGTPNYKVTMSLYHLGQGEGRVLGCSSGCIPSRWLELDYSIVIHGSCQAEQSQVSLT